MKAIIIQLTFLLSLISVGLETYGQEAPLLRNYQFEVGDVVSSSDGSLQGQLRKSNNADEYLVGVFAGLNSNRRNEVIKSEGVTSVKISDLNGIVHEGDLLAPGEGGVAVKSIGNGMILGVALSDPKDGMVRIRLSVMHRADFK
ncbi:MAG: hypothetical protein H6601_05215 [Flavobacteriales bacterium]|nr:hypothetical protein [Flavobacteriales bacterium]